MVGERVFVFNSLDGELTVQKLQLIHSVSYKISENSWRLKLYLENLKLCLNDNHF